jgi:Uma2 family endonuclease
MERKRWTRAECDALESSGLLANERLELVEGDLIDKKGEKRPRPFANPTPADLRLVVEIAHSSLTFDLTTKASLYARAGIVEYWVLDVTQRRLIVHRDPAAGRYTSVVSYDETESVAPLAVPDAAFLVSTAFAA